jgi:hypothetical protein
MGLALAFSGSFDWASTFLNTSNHKPGVPLDYFSFHFYSSPSSRTNVTAFEDMIVPNVNAFLPNAQKMVQIRNSVNPNVKISVDEIGCILVSVCVVCFKRWVNSDNGTSLMIIITMRLLQLVT